MQQLWVGHGLRLLRRAWGADPPPTPNEDRDVELAALEFAIKLTGSLAELGWGGWKAVGMPLVMRMCVAEKVLELDGQGVLELLAVLRRGKKLSAGDTDLVWRGKLEKWLLGKLRCWEVGAGGSVKVGFAVIITLLADGLIFFRLES
jgi:U3 small nucleolar RNA-associated protein 20